MERLFLLLLLLFINARSPVFATEKKFIDPFTNPIKVEEEKLMKLKINKNSEEESKEKIAKIFKPILPKPFNKLIIQGVISIDNKYILVVLDPETGETYLLKEGNAISPFEKIVEITPSKIVIARYYYKRGKLFKSYETLNVNLEG